MENISNLLSTVIQKNNERLEKFQNEAPKMAPKFKLLNFIKPDLNEMNLSNMIAFLLNPKASHAQGDLFLKAFLKVLNLNFVPDCNSVNITKEKRIPNDRRIDIHLKFSNGEIGIENKP